MGAAVAGLTFLPPQRSGDELVALLDDTRLVRLGDPQLEVKPFVALHEDRGVPITILYSHGNAEDLIDMKGSLRQLSQNFNANVMVYDYSGYGLSSGCCSEQACCAAARLCLEYLQNTGVERESVVLMGKSLGTGPSIDLASRVQGLAGVVLLSPFLSVLRTRFPEGVAHTLKEADLFNNGEKLPSVTCPLFVVHGTEDTVVPLEQGMGVQRLAPNAVRPWWVQGAGHNDLHTHPDFVIKVCEFLGFVRARQRRRWEETVAAFKRHMVVLPRPQECQLLAAAM